ncbi:hypothetical protein KUCAC02_021160, partial [Chaenocephalus aceratus]
TFPKPRAQTEPLFSPSQCPARPPASIFNSLMLLTGPFLDLAPHTLKASEINRNAPLPGPFSLHSYKLSMNNLPRSNLTHILAAEIVDDLLCDRPPYERQAVAVISSLPPSTSLLPLGPHLSPLVSIPHAQHVCQGRACEDTDLNSLFVCCIDG